MKTHPRLKLFALAVFAASLPMLGSDVRAEGTNVVPNGDFAAGTDGWELFIGPEFKDTGAVADLSVTPGAGPNGQAAGTMTTDVPIRYSISTVRANVVPVDAGAKYKVTAWVKVAEGAEATPGRAAIYVRLALVDSANKPTQDPLGNIHIGLKDQVVRTPQANQLVTSDLPFEWQKIQAEVEIPEDTASVVVGLFADRIKGTAYWSDVSLEKIEKP